MKPLAIFILLLAISSAWAQPPLPPAVKPVVLYRTGATNQTASGFNLYTVNAPAASTPYLLNVMLIY